MNTATQRERVTLYYRQGNSDKIYEASIEPDGNLFAVSFAYGRRGSTLNTGRKTVESVPHAEAKRIYDKLVNEKLAKGYSPGQAGTPYQHTPKEQRNTGVMPQLLNPVDESELEHYITDDRWWFQEKFDGRRLLVRKDRQHVIGINRSGLTVALSLPLANAVADLSVESCLIDGESVGELYHAFDLLERDGMDLRPSPYAVRHAELMDLVDNVATECIRYTPVATDAGAKRLMLDVLRRDKREGVVLKGRLRPYTAGRPASGGTQLKVKFYATVSCIVARANGNRRSVALQLFQDTTPVDVGSVTVPPCHAVPAAGQVIEVRYLYAFQGGCLYQPVFIGVRDDVTPAECRTTQLKYKPDAEE